MPRTSASSSKNVGEIGKGDCAMHRSAWIVIGSVLILILLNFTRGGSAPDADKHSPDSAALPEPKTPHNQRDSQVPVATVPDESLPSQSPSPASQAVAAEVSSAAPATQPLWTVNADYDDSDRTTAASTHASVGKPVSIDRDAIAQMRTGQRLSIAIPQLGKAYEGTVNKVTTHPNGDVTWRGQLEGEAEGFDVVITQGRLTSFASVDTPQGSYELAAQGNQGWVAAATELNGAIDYNRPDYVLPPLTGSQ